MSPTMLHRLAELVVTHELLSAPTIATLREHLEQYMREEPLLAPTGSISQRSLVETSKARSNDVFQLTW